MPHGSFLGQTLRHCISPPMVLKDKSGIHVRAGPLSWRPLGGLVLVPGSWGRMAVLSNLWLAAVSPGTNVSLPSPRGSASSPSEGAGRTGQAPSHRLPMCSPADAISEREHSHGSGD